MIKYKHIKVLLASILGLSFYFLVKNKEAGYKPPPMSSMPVEKTYSKLGKNHSVIEVVKVNNVNQVPLQIQIEIDSMKQMIEAQNVKIEAYKSFQVEQLNEGKLSIESDSLWFYSDDNTSLNVNPLNLDFSYKSNVKLVQIDYLKRGLFRSNKSYSDLFSMDPMVTINNQKSIRINHKNKMPVIRPGVHVGYGYMPFSNESGFVVSVGLNMNL